MPNYPSCIILCAHSGQIPIQNELKNRPSSIKKRVEHGTTKWPSDKNIGKEPNQFNSWNHFKLKKISRNDDCIIHLCLVNWFRSQMQNQRKPWSKSLVTNHSSHPWSTSLATHHTLTSSKTHYNEVNCHKVRNEALNQRQNQLNREEEMGLSTSSYRYTKTLSWAASVCIHKTWVPLYGDNGRENEICGLT